MSFNFIKKNITISFVALCAGGTFNAHAADFTAKDFDLEAFGFVRLDAVYDLDADLGDPSIVRYGSIRRPESPKVSDGNVEMTANVSRLGFNIKGPGGVTAKISGDFFPGSFRLRHGYSVWNGFLIGQTWANFNTMVASVGQLNFIGPSGRAGFDRKPQIRYTTNVGGNKLAVALEDPDGLVFNKQTSNTMPDLTGRFQGSTGSFLYSVSATARNVEYIADGKNEKTATGYGVALAGRYTLPTGTQLKASYVYGDGIGNQMSSSPAPVAFASQDGSLETIEQVGFALAIRQTFSNRVAGNLGYASSEADWDEAVSAGSVDPKDVNESRSSIFANITYEPIKNYMLGFEFSRHSVEWADGEDEQNNRLLFVSQYDF
ncbi:DcaP family trimeric outer membrane transporter [uncultured Marinobacter sp.]|jgi:hypothetical protein|uniref:DcaP family trimeric outer membrane transporter n=1 Tax=uncultured Marinobacter sp. TaxID=187379 RepID=UPI0030C8CB3A|tara:strand:- start:163 stop:1287 length:1125 start_codon:yes stop_codon:yes gene_type:complete